MKYPYYVAMAVPDASLEAANQAVAETTGRAADVDTFRIEHTAAAGSTWWVASMPMTKANFERLPELQDAIGGEYGVLREVVGGDIVRHQTLGEWTAELGLTRGYGVIDVNTATVDELTALSGVGPSLAEKIVDDRPYEAVGDLTRVSGISEGMVDGWEVVA